MSSRQEGAKNRVLFVCIENSTRSVMAEGFAKKLGLDASSAGTVPSTHVNSLVVEAMKEVRIDVSHVKPKELDGRMIDDAALVVLTDASLERAIPGDLRKKMRKKVVEWNLPDPQGRSIEEIRYIRDEIEGMVKALARSFLTTP
jgi:arsenate reductase (thioredoxin)